MDGNKPSVYVGLQDQSPGRTIREADVVLFAGISGDYAAIHTDEVYSRDTYFGRPIAHGLLGLSIASGLWTRTDAARLIMPCMVALLNTNWNFNKPIFFGDTVRLGLRILELKPSSSGQYVVMTMERWLDSETDERVQHGTFQNLLRQEGLDVDFG